MQLAFIFLDKETILPGSYLNQQRKEWKALTRHWPRQLHNAANSLGPVPGKKQKAAHVIRKEDTFDQSQVENGRGFPLTKYQIRRYTQFYLENKCICLGLLSLAVFIFYKHTRKLAFKSQEQQMGSIIKKIIFKILSFSLFLFSKAH